MQMNVLNRIIISVSLLLSLLIVSCGTEEYQAVVGQIEGTVLDSQTNEPVKGCQIISNDYGTKHTDDKGHFMFENLSPGNVSLTYQCNGYETATRVVNVIAGQQVSANISLNPMEIESGIQPKQTILDFGTRTNILDLILTNKSNTTQSFSISCDYKELFFDPSQGRIVAGSDIIVKVSIDRSDLSEGHYERIFTIETAERKIDIQVVFDKGNVVRPIVKTVSLSQSVDIPSRIIAEGDVTVIGSSSISNYGFCYSTSTDPTLETNDGFTKMGSMASPSHFSGMLSDMEYDKEYRVRAYATNNEGTGYGEVLTIVLKQKKDFDIITEDATDVAATSVNLNGQIKNVSATDLTELGFYYGTTQNCDKRISCEKIEGKTKFSMNLSDLKEDTEYYFRAFGVCDGIEKTGDLKTFQTEKSVSDGGIVCVTSGASEILSSSAKLNGNIRSDKKTSITEWGFYYGTNSNPSKRKVGESYQSPKLIESQNVSLTIDALEEDREYYFAVYVIDESNNVIKGSVESFKTTTTPNIKINSLKMSSIKAENNWFLFEGEGTLSPQGQTVIEAGFLCRTDGYDFSYENSSEDILGPYNNDHTYRLVCEIENNLIKGSAKVFNRSFLYVKAYMILADGTIIYNDKYRLENGTIYVSTDLWYPDK